MKKNGYTIPELMGVVLIVGIIAIIGITKVSYAFEEINNPETQQKEIRSLVSQASEAYARSKKADFKKDEETFIFAKDVVAAGFLFEKEIYNSMKVRISYDSSTDSFHAEVLN